MTQQISVEDALAAFRKKYADAADENVLLHARITGLERELDAAQQENQRRQQTAAEPAGPDLAAQPTYDEPRG